MKKLYSKVGAFLSLISVIFHLLFMISNFDLRDIINGGIKYIIIIEIVVFLCSYLLGAIIEAFYHLFKKLFNNKSYYKLLLIIFFIIIFTGGLVVAFKNYFKISDCPEGQERYYYSDDSGQSSCGPSIKDGLYWMNKSVKNIEECYNFKPNNLPAKVQKTDDGFNYATINFDRCIDRYVDSNNNVVDKKICEEITSTHIKYLCLTKIAIHLSDPSLCKLEFLNDQDNVDNCLNMLAASLKDPSLCERSSQPSFCKYGAQGN